MKPNWSLIACSAFFVVAVFGAAVVDGFNNSAAVLNDTAVAAR